MDVLSDVLNAVRMTGAIYFDIDASSPWIGESPPTTRIAAAVMPQAEHIITLHAVISGSCWAAIGDDSLPPVLVNAGDIVCFPGGASYVLSSAIGSRSESNMGMFYIPVDDHLPFSVLH